MVAMCLGVLLAVTGQESGLARKVTSILWFGCNMRNCVGMSLPLTSAMSIRTRTSTGTRSTGKGSTVASSPGTQ